MDYKFDLFDRIMVLPVERTFNPMYQKYKESILYILFGSLTTLLSTVLIRVFTKPMHIPALEANGLGCFGSISDSYGIFHASGKLHFCLDY